MLSQNNRYYFKKFYRLMRKVYYIYEVIRKKK